MDLAQPGVLRIPRVVHRHRALGHCGKRILVPVAGLHLQRLVVERQRVEIGSMRLARWAGGLRVMPALRGETEFLQHFGIQVDQDRFVIARDAVALRPFQIPLFQLRMY